MGRKYKSIKVRVPVSRLPTRNWGQTVARTKQIGKTIQSSYATYKGVIKKTEPIPQNIKSTVNTVRRIGVERTITNKKSIYAPRPSTTITKKIKEVKKNLGFGIYG